MRRGLRCPRRPGKRLDEAPPRGARASRRPSTGPIRSQHSVCDAVDPAKCPKRTVRHNAAENVQNLIAPELGGYGMNPTFTAAVAALIFAGGFAGSVAAGPFEDATAAYKKGDYATALELMRPLAEEGDVAAQFNLGVMYQLSHGVPQDNGAAVSWYRKAAEWGAARIIETPG
jgi:hypothetical protein